MKCTCNYHHVFAGTSVGGEDVVQPTSAGHSHHVLVTKLRMQTGQLYHITVKGIAKEYLSSGHGLHFITYI